MRRKRGRPKTAGPKMNRRLIALVTREDVLAVRKYAKDQNVSVGEVVRRALTNFGAIES
jgi:hypothetical protein